MVLLTEAQHVAYSMLIFIFNYGVENDVILIDHHM